jgi:hypothetical protein
VSCCRARRGIAQAPTGPDNGRALYNTCPLQRMLPGHHIPVPRSQDHTTWCLQTKEDSEASSLTCNPTERFLLEKVTVAYLVLWGYAVA